MEDGLEWDKTSYWKTSQEAIAAILIGELGQRQIKGLELAEIGYSPDEIFTWDYYTNPGTSLSAG